MTHPADLFLIKPRRHQRGLAVRLLASSVLCHDVLFFWERRTSAEKRHDLNRLGVTLRQKL